MAGDLDFDWDEGNISHVARHNVTCDEAEQAILNGFVEIEYQVTNDEERRVVVGISNAGRFLTIVWMFREEAIRVVTGWDSTKQEQQAYWSERGV